MSFELTAAEVFEPAAAGFGTGNQVRTPLRTTLFFNGRRLVSKLLPLPFKSTAYNSMGVESLAW
jgi:hypothetical protein